MMEAEQADAVGHFFADSIEALQAGHGLRIRHLPDGIQIQRAGACILAQPFYVFGPVTQFQRLQIP